MHHPKTIPNFQFKIRFNSIYNTWEVWTYRLGETDPAKAKWMQCTTDTAKWYHTVKNANIEVFDPRNELRTMTANEDVFITDLVDAITQKETDSFELKSKRELLDSLVRAFMNNPVTESDGKAMATIVQLVEEIKKKQESEQSLATWVTTISKFDDSGISDLTE